MTQIQRTTGIAFVFVLLAVICGGCTRGESSTVQHEHNSGSHESANAATREDSKTQVAIKNEDAGQKLFELSPGYETCPSLVQVLARPEYYHGKEIMVEGYLVVEFEGTAIYLSKDDADFMTRNGFWVSFEKNTLDLSDAEIAKRFNCKYVRLQGTFDAGNSGHLGEWLGAIGNVSRLEALNRVRHDKGATGPKKTRAPNQTTGKGIMDQKGSTSDRVPPSIEYEPASVKEAKEKR
jgi:hypothetical protein